jgi:hypothetical protein
MNLFHLLFDNNLWQRMDLERLDQRADRLHADLWSESYKNRDLAEENDSLRHEVSKLVLVVEAMHRLALEKNLWTAEEMAKALEAADLEDGVADGRKTPVARAPKPVCAGCGRPMPPRVARCSHCNRRRV